MNNKPDVDFVVQYLFPQGNRWRDFAYCNEDKLAANVEKCRGIHGLSQVRTRKRTLETIHTYRPRKRLAAINPKDTKAGK